MENKEAQKADIKQTDNLFEHEMTELYFALKDEFRKISGLAPECEKIDEVVPKAELPDNDMHVDIKKLAFGKASQEFTPINNKFSAPAEIDFAEIKTDVGFIPPEIKVPSDADVAVAEVQTATDYKLPGIKGLTDADVAVAEVQTATGYKLSGIKGLTGVDLAAAEVQTAKDFTLLRIKELSFDDVSVAEVKTATGHAPIEIKELTDADVSVADVQVATGYTLPEIKEQTDADVSVAYVQVATGYTLPDIKRLAKDDVSPIKVKTIAGFNTPEISGIKEKEVILEKKMQISTDYNAPAIQGVNPQTAMIGHIPEVISVDTRSLIKIEYEHNQMPPVAFVEPETDELIKEIDELMLTIVSPSTDNEKIEEIMNMEFNAPNISSNIADIMESVRKEYA